MGWFAPCPIYNTAHHWTHPTHHPKRHQYLLSQFFTITRQYKQSTDTCNFRCMLFLRHRTEWLGLITHRAFWHCERQTDASTDGCTAAVGLPYAVVCIGMLHCLCMHSASVQCMLLARVCCDCSATPFTASWRAENKRGTDCSRAESTSGWIADRLQKHCVTKILNISLFYDL